MCSNNNENNTNNGNGNAVQKPDLDSVVTADTILQTRNFEIESNDEKKR